MKSKHSFNNLLHTHALISKLCVALLTLQLVDPPAVLPYFSAGASEGTNVSHPDHGGGEIGEKGGRVGAVGTHYGVSGTTIEELLVGMDEALLLNEVLEVVVVKEPGSGEVNGC